MSAYIHSPQAAESARELVYIKVQRQKILLGKYAKKLSIPDAEPRTISGLMLFEARVAKTYWRGFRLLMPPSVGFTGRKPRKEDIGNHLLDIGYHHLTNVVEKLLLKHSVSTALGLFHVARNADSAPLAYDMVEMFRADIVDAETLRFFRLKKKKNIEALEPEYIARFLHRVNTRLERKYYLKEFKGCHSYRYYMELQILKFIKAVNHAEVFSPLHLPTRHESRCHGRLTPALEVLN